MCDRQIERERKGSDIGTEEEEKEQEDDDGQAEKRASRVVRKKRRQLYRKRTISRAGGQPRIHTQKSYRIFSAIIIIRTTSVRECDRTGSEKQLKGLHVPGLYLSTYSTTTLITDG